MANKRLLYTTAAGIRVFGEVNGPDVVFHQTQDVTPIIEANKAKKLAGGGYNKARDLYHAADVPIVLLKAWAQEWGFCPSKIFADDEFKAKAWARLNDADYRDLRTSEGRV